MLLVSLRLKINGSINSVFPGAALRSGCPSAKNSVEAESDCLLKKLNVYKIGNEVLMKTITEMDAVVKALSTSLLNMIKKVATIETESAPLTQYITQK